MELISDTLTEDLGAVRRRTLRLVEHLDAADLERQLDPILSPLVWDLAHIAAYEDLWLVHRHGGESLLRADLAAVYDAFETPRAVRGDVELLDHVGSLDYLEAVRERTLATLDRRGPDPVLHEMVLRHELQHTETMRQAMAFAGVLPPGEPPAAPAGGEGWLDVPASIGGMGAGPDGFAYDNERPRHPVAVAAFRIARGPVTNATWMRFAEEGGYARREWWSDEGWAWKEEHDAAPHPSIADGDPGAPACHVSWFEAEALARWSGARLPTEAEWERAATWDGDGLAGAGLDGAGLAGVRVDGVGLAGVRVDGVGRDGAGLAGAGRVWEWTASPFGPYPGFRAHPYPEYSEVFFGDRYRVLRGGSWATHPRVATPTFRNWDLPQRRHLFAGVRLAADAEAA